MSCLKIDPIREESLSPCLISIHARVRTGVLCGTIEPVWCCLYALNCFTWWCARQVKLGRFRQKLPRLNLFSLILSLTKALLALSITLSWFQTYSVFTNGSPCFWEQSKLYMEIPLYPSPHLCIYSPLIFFIFYFFLCIRCYSK